MTSRHPMNATCPECRGPLREIHEGDIVEYACLVGHRYAPRVLLHAHVQAQERALWAAIVALEETENLVAAVGQYLPQSVRDSLESEVKRKLDQAARIREIVHQLTPFRTD
jgi:two-component system, chemotaxis family, protein-glutamate methylesterase/glutaminase